MCAIVTDGGNPPRPKHFLLSWIGHRVDPGSGDHRQSYVHMAQSNLAPGADLTLAEDSRQVVPYGCRSRLYALKLLGASTQEQEVPQISCPGHQACSEPDRWLRGELSNYSITNAASLTFPRPETVKTDCL